MRLPFAVYTAFEGYGWASGLGHGRGLLERLRRTVGKTPDFDYGAPGCCGAVNDGDTVVVYRFMRAEKWDSKGRNAAYLALSFFPRVEAGAVDVERLLGLEPFRVPMREPPEWLEYAGGEAGVSAFDPDSDAEVAPTVDFRNAGRVFAKPFAGTLRVCREEVAGCDGCRVDYRQPIRSVTHESAAEAVSESQRNASEFNSDAMGGEESRLPRCFVATTVAAGLVAVSGGAFWLLVQTDGGEKTGPDHAPKKSLTAVVGTTDLVSSDGHWLGLASSRFQACGVQKKVAKAGPRLGNGETCADKD